MRGLVSYLLVPRNPSWDFEAVRGNPVRLRNCPAAVSGNDITIVAHPVLESVGGDQALGFGLGSGDVGLVGRRGAHESEYLPERVVHSACTTASEVSRADRGRPTIHSGAGV